MTVGSILEYLLLAEYFRKTACYMSDRRYTVPVQEWLKQVGIWDYVNFDPLTRFRHKNV